MLDWNEVSRRRGISAGVTILSGLALLAPLRPAERPETTVGLFLLIAAFLEWLHGQRRATTAARFAAWRESTVTLGMGALLLFAPLLSGNALVVFLAASFAYEGIRHLYRLWRRPDRARHARRLTTALLDLAAGGAMLFLLNANAAITWTVAIAGALRLFDTARRLATVPVSSADLFGDELIQNLRLLDVPELKSLGDTLEVEASLRAPIDRGWVLAFLATLYSIHAGRMGIGFTLGGVLAPAAAVLGDVVIAVLFTMCLALPVHLLLQRL
ncbi:MAG: DUF308 domain-containing protein, partial [Acidobacteria bacterium]|nr:DUF308 domain-containing protein [Acidobacteriota bacterium]